MNLKFRVWDKEKKKFASVAAILLRPDCDKFYCFSSNDLNRFVFQQFTGYKDKNQKEIYEGDIVKCRALSTTETVTVKDIRNVPVQITVWPELYKGGNCKVIGNIFKKPKS